MQYTHGGTNQAWERSGNLCKGKLLVLMYCFQFEELKPDTRVLRSPNSTHAVILQILFVDLRFPHMYENSQICPKQIVAANAPPQSSKVAAKLQGPIQHDGCSESCASNTWQKHSNVALIQDYQKQEYIQLWKNGNALFHVKILKPSLQGVSPSRSGGIYLSPNSLT